MIIVNATPIYTSTYQGIPLIKHYTAIYSITACHIGLH